jgi:ADP-heptose:LPS heptosyltransferase
MFLDVPLIFDKKGHIFKDNRAFLKEGLGIKAIDDWPEVITDEADERIVEAVIKDNNLDKFICVCPIAGLPEKQWALENFRELLDWLYEKYPEYKIVLIGTEKDRYTLQFGLAVPGAVILLDYNVRRLPLLFKKSALVIAHDGGPMHSAWLTGSKTIALYPAEVADKFIPLKNCRTFQSDSMQDMLSIELKDVKKAVEEML